MNGIICFFAALTGYGMGICVAIGAGKVAAISGPIILLVGILGILFLTYKNIKD